MTKKTLGQVILFCSDRTGPRVVTVITKMCYVPLCQPCAQQGFKQKVRAKALYVITVRLLDVDNKVLNKVLICYIRLIITGVDSFSVPSLELKIDAVPGRLDQPSIIAERTGAFYGQCSEICGV